MESKRLPLDYPGGCFAVEPSPAGYVLRHHRPGKPDEVCRPVPMPGIPSSAGTGACVFNFRSEAEGTR